MPKIRYICDAVLANEEKPKHTCLGYFYRFSCKANLDSVNLFCEKIYAWVAFLSYST